MKYMVLIVCVVISAMGVKAQHADSLELFRNITDIEKLLNKDTALGDTLRRVSIEGAPSIPVIPPADLAAYPKPQLSSLDRQYRRKANGTLVLPDNLYDSESLRGLTFRDTLFYDPLFLPMIFTGQILPRELSFYSTQDQSGKGLLIPQSETFAPQLKRQDFIRQVRNNYYSLYPDRVAYSVFDFKEKAPGTSEDEILKSFDPFKELISAETSFSLEAPEVEGVTIGRKYWIWNGDHSLQFSQNYFSENWHKGGNSFLNINNNHVIKANYKKEKVSFENTLEWRLSLFTAPEDTIRRYRIGDDMIRYYGVFGLESFIRRWAYSTNLELKTQMFNNYLSNSHKIRSAFLAPIYVNGGIGMRYALDKKSKKVRHRRVCWNVDLSPTSVDFVFVGNDKVNASRYGIPDGSRFRLQVGSSVISNLKFDFTKYITWDSRFKYFTSYQNILIEFENTLNASLSRFFSTRLYLNLRYDDSVKPDPKFKYLQVNEMISFGLNYKW